MDLNTVLILACAIGFIISAIDYWIDLGFWRAIIALALGAAGAFVLGAPLTDLLISGLAAGFIGLGLLQVIERVNFGGRLR